MRRALAAVVLLLVAACGSTVQTRQQLTDGGSGPLDGVSPASPGAQLGDGTGGTSSGGASGSATTGGPGPGGTSTAGGAAVVPGVSGGSSGAPTTGGGAGPQASHESIQIGFVTTSVGNAEALGVNAGQSYTDKAMFEALVAEYNAAGGVAGHRIVPVYGATDTASSNWANQFNAVCAQFTQDHHVRAVIGYIFVFLPSFENCLVKARVPHLYGGYQPGDVVDQQHYPTLLGTGHPTTDGYTLTALDGALRTGLLNSKTKLGIIIDTCADGDRAYSRTIEPWLKAHHVSYKTVIGDCAQGASDVSGAAAAISSAELSFASSGVNLVLASAVELLIFMQDAQSQNYAPEYLTGVGGAALEANAPANQMKHLHGFGWMPAVDVDPQHQPYPQTAAQKACVAKLVKHGLRPAAYNDFMAAYQACDGLELYARALAAKGSAAAPGAIIDGVVAALPSFRGAGTYGGVLRAAPHQRGGPAAYRQYGWTGGCSCLTYRGPTYPVPTP
jgi:hypothetical protein